MTADDRSRLAPSPTAVRPDRRLEAPHRRGGASPRIVEQTAVLAYRATAWLLASLPPKPAATLIGWLSQASYLMWPTKRRWSNRNFGHVLGLPPDHRRVREAALSAYMGYGRYLVELMRLPTRPAEDIARLVPVLDVDDVRRIWQGSPGGLIMTVGHVGSNEAVAAAIAHHGMPISVVADDSAFPEIYEILRRQREGWGVRLIAWRNLREIFGVLRRREILGLLVDWGYRSDGIPIRLFGEWTALPAGPATLAAKTRSLILPITIRRQPDDTFHVSWSSPIEVPSADPADLQRATQAIADALAATIAAAPDQWYSFKPIWPATAEEAADLERRATGMLAGVPDPGPAPEFA
ncbi:MAG TPA: lysophospholipid acyltransferase family protein [Candidatus Limnocylindrales bacterium]|nr:lysophospholipid acyltransferase family protein [Candidatus Limnocylindrales bacterium]